MYTIIFDKSKEITKVRETSAYPHKSNCVEVIVGDLTITYLNKVELELAEKMREILSQEQIDALLPFIEEFGSERYNEGSTDESMNNENN